MIGEKVGKYKILEVVGSGSLGIVYKGEDPDGHPVAVKRVRSQILSSMEKREQFLRHVLLASEIRNKCICPVLEIGDEENDFFIIMPLINGKTLENYMERRPLPYVQALDIAEAAGSALCAVHGASGVHRGLKPSNIWILDAPKLAVMLSDCGMATPMDIAANSGLPNSGRAPDFADMHIPQGALAYMSPEQLRGEPLDHRTDIFSFGVVLYEMLSGRHPFETGSLPLRINAILETEPPPLASKRSQISSRLESVVRKALAKAPDARYQSMNALLSELQNARRDDLSMSPQAKLPVMIRRWISQKLYRKSRIRNT